MPDSMSTPVPGRWYYIDGQLMKCWLVVYSPAGGDVEATEISSVVVTSPHKPSWRGSYTIEAWDRHMPVPYMNGGPDAA